MAVFFQNHDQSKLSPFSTSVISFTSTTTDPSRQGSSQTQHQHHIPQSPKRSATGIALEPQPSSSRHDPLNWPLRRKLLTLGIVSFAALIGIAQSTAGAAGIVLQAAQFRRPPADLAAGSSVGLAGLATGPFLWTAAANVFGRPSVIFWALLAAAACVLWSAEMTSPGEYVPFMLSRWLACTFSSAPTTLGGGVILDVFFLHQRGRAFACYSACVLFGVVVGAMFGGYLAGGVGWQAQFWWVAAALVFCSALVAVGLEDTTFDRRLERRAGVHGSGEKVVGGGEGAGEGEGEGEMSWWWKRVLTLCAGHRMLARTLPRHGPFDAVLIGLQPVTLLAGLALTITFGWGVANQVLLNLVLQLPAAKGGYGFSPTASASFYFVQWISLLVAELYGFAFNDRLPLWMCRRYGQGKWRAEYRLYPLLVAPGIVLPVGLGLFGAAVEHHLPVEVLALAVFLIHAAEIATVPAVVNYVSECFVRHSTEVTTVLNFYRLVLGLTVSFYAGSWQKKVGAGWTFGTMGFIAIAGYLILAALAWKGDRIRRWGWWKGASEDEERLFGGISGENLTQG